MANEIIVKRGMIVQGISAQTTALMELFDSSDNSLFKVWYTGHLETKDGFRTTQAQYGPALWTHLYGEDTPEHTNQTGSYDHTGGTSEKLFTKSAGDDFTQADADNGSWILLTGTNLGAVAEIKEFLSATTVVVDGMGWDGDLASQTFVIYKHPGFYSGGANHEFSVEATGEFEVYSYNFTGSTVAEIKLDSAADDCTALKIEVDGNGYSDLDALRITVNTGDIQPMDTLDLLHITVNEVLASSADATTEINAIFLQKTNANTTHSDGIRIGPGFSDALHVTGTPAINPGYGYEVTSGTVTDRVNSGGAGDDAFVNSAVDQLIFDSTNDYILIGSDNTFEKIAVTLATPGSQNSSLQFFYSVAGAGFSGWTRFYPSDTTNGFQNSGTITFAAPGAWAKDDQAQANGDITDAYYIGIKRTKLGTYTRPTEDHFEIYADREGGMSIRGDGVVILPYLGDAPASLENGMMWMEADGLHLYYSGGEQIVTVA